MVQNSKNKRKTIEYASNEEEMESNNKNNIEVNAMTLQEKHVQKLYAVSDTQEVYLCINATNKEHSCDFGLCRDCYLKDVPTRIKRRRTTDVDDSLCNHKCFASLHQFFDKQFFAKDYMEQVKKRNISWTSHCAKCKAKFVSMGRNDNIV